MCNRKLFVRSQKEIAKYLNDKCLKIDDLISKMKYLFEDLEEYKKSLIYEHIA